MYLVAIAPEAGQTARYTNPYDVGALVRLWPACELQLAPLEGIYSKDEQ